MNIKKKSQKKYSISKLNEWGNCQLRYYGHYIDSDNWENSFDNNINTDLGNLIHNYFYDFYQKDDLYLQFKNNLYTIEQWQNEFIIDWQNITNEKEYEADSIIINQDKGLQCLYNFYNREKSNNFRRPLYLEKFFSIEINNEYLINGKIDRIDRDINGKIHIIDYKISNYTNTVSDASNNAQLLVYAMAFNESILKDSDIPNIGWYYPLQDLFIENEPNFDEQINIFNKFLELDHIIEINGKDKKAYKINKITGFCDNCGYRKHCPEYKDEYINENNMPEYHEIMQIINNINNLKSQIEEIKNNNNLANLENEIEEYKKILMNYMIENDLKKIDNISLNYTYKEDREIIWNILKNNINADKYFKPNIKAIKDEYIAINTNEKEILDNAIYNEANPYIRINKKKNI